MTSLPFATERNLIIRKALTKPYIKLVLHVLQYNCICRLSFTPWVGESLQWRRGKLTPVTQWFDIDQEIRQVYALTAFTHAQDRATLRSDLSGV